MRRYFGNTSLFMEKVADAEAVKYLRLADAKAVKQFRLTDAETVKQRRLEDAVKGKDGGTNEERELVNGERQREKRLR